MEDVEKKLKVFGIDGSNLITSDNASYVLDYEVPGDDDGDNEYEITITTTDSGGLTYSEDFTITVSDVNETPTGISLSETSTDEERSAESIIGTLSSTDVDSGDTFTYTVSGTDADYFGINNNSALITRERHRIKLNQCLKEIDNFLKKDQNKDLELAAEDLRMATRHLGSIVGKVDVEEILGSIFKDFCIGK